MDAFTEIFDHLDRELWIVTAQAGDLRSGLIATYASRVSLVPELPRVTIALAKHHFTHALIEQSGSLCMHLIAEDQLEWVWRFGIRSGRDIDKFDGLSTSNMRGGAPVLPGSLAWLDCRVESRIDIGDRTIYLAEVLEAKCETTAEPLTFKRLLELAPADKLRELKLAIGPDVELDRKAILDWRRGRRSG
jgi:flavin reductase (DIM6/NTAB) family NADH-FMN oxidoreductase RutF